MRDLKLWRKLQAEEHDDELVALVAELTQLEPRQRLTFFSALSRLCFAEREDLRAACIAALSGVRGRAGLQLIVGALDDDSAGVRQAAVEALRRTANDAPARWAHAVFHPRADVRARALEGTIPTHAAHYGIYLRADSENAAQATDCPWPKNALPLLFDFCRRGAVDREEAARRLGHANIAALRDFLWQSYRRTDEQVDAFIGAATEQAGLPEPLGRDILDEWVDIVAAVDERALPCASLVEAVIDSADRSLRSRALVAVLGGGIDRLGDYGAQICAACLPRFVAFPTVDVEVRRAGARGLFDHRARIGRLSAKEVDRLLGADVVRRADGSIDVRTAIAIAGLRPDRRIDAITDALGLEEVVEALIDDLRSWTMICQLPADSALGADWLLTLIQAHAPERWPAHAGIALCSWAASASMRYTHLRASLDGSRATDVLIALVGLQQRGEFEPGQGGARVIKALRAEIPLGGMRGLLEAVLSAGGKTPGRFARDVAACVAAVLDADAFAHEAVALRPESLARLLTWLDEFGDLTLSYERAIATLLEKHEDDEMRRWAVRLLNAPSGRAPSLRTTADVRRLSQAEIDRIRECDFGDLEAALQPALKGPSLGLCAALGGREDPGTHHLAACVALLGCHDHVIDVGTQLDRFYGKQDDFWIAVTSDAVARWQGNAGLPPLGNAWLSNWEAHGFAVMEWATAGAGGLHGALKLTLEIPSVTVRHTLWRGLASVILIWRYRDPARLKQVFDEETVELLVAQLDTELGLSAAKMLVAAFAAEHLAATFASLKDRALELGPDMQTEVRRELDRWVRLDGLPARRAAARESRVEERVSLIEAIRESEDLDFLEEQCRSGRSRLIHEASVRLIELGADGEARLVTILSATPPVAQVSFIAESVPLWSGPVSLAKARELAQDESLSPQLRYTLALAFKERGEMGWLEVALTAASTPTEHLWFSLKDHRKLLEVANDDRRVALALANAPYPHAYQKSVEYLLEQSLDRHIRDALLRFLECGTARPGRLRRKAAHKLWQSGTVEVLPVIVDHVTDPAEPIHRWLLEKGDREQLAELFLDAGLVGGQGILREEMLLWLLDALALAEPGRTEKLTRLLTESIDAVARQRVIHQLGPDPTQETKLRRIAEIFAWGVRRGRELTGKLFRVHVTSRREDFGYTQLDQNRIYVSPLALLSGDRQGQDIVEALILHEFGHHVFHAGPGAAEIWSKAQRAGLFPLLNIVADEHLERNLRALEPEYGDRLKRLASYAFQHSEREIPVEHLVGMLLGGSFEALTSQALGVAYAEDSVVVQRGHLLRELDKLGHPFARFVRALRMGLGDRNDDALVRAGLDLFKGGFRKSDMQQLWQITLQLAQLFGGAASLAKTFGGHETLEWDERQASILGAGIEDDDVQREVERILDPRQKRKGDGKGKGHLAINVIQDPTFDLIERIERIPDDPSRHRELAQETRRHADRLRGYLHALGLALVPRRARLRGRSFDRTRARAVVLRRDPRMLVAREIEVHNDLFIGVCIDCSGSMSVGDSMNKAHHFGVMLAEAVRPLHGVDARFFGFTDDLLYDAGDDQRCAVASLVPGGGNNDAAALHHAARVAQASRRKAKLLIMISDGLPTECSVQALRGLVDHLTRRKRLLCAQVAVRPLEEVCFPHYVEVKSADIDTCVRRFGEIISGLARRALGR